MALSAAPLPLHWLRAVCLLVALVLSCDSPWLQLPGSVPVSSWHFAFGTLSWQQSWSNGSYARYQVTMQQAWNSSWHWCTSNLILSPQVKSSQCSSYSIAVGDVISTCSEGAEAFVQVNDLTSGQTNVNKYLTTLSFNSTVTAMYPLDVVFASTSVFSIGPFPASHRLLVAFEMCCRVSYLWPPNEGGTRDAIVTTTIAPNVSYSFNTTNPPRTYAYVNEPIPMQIQVSALQPGQTVNFSISPTAYSGLLQAAPTNLTVNNATGVVNWTTANIGVFAVQFTIQDVQTGFWIALDTLIETFAQTAHPVFAPLPATWNFAVSVEGAYTVSVSEPDPQRIITVTAAGGPSSASFSLLSTTVTANSTSSLYTYRWTPGPDDFSSTVCFQAYDDLGFFNSGNLCVTLVVVTGNLLVLSGTIRDFHTAAVAYALLPDFNNTAGGDTTLQFVNTTIAANSTDRLPAFNTSLAPSATTTTNASHFSQWWNTDPAQLVSVGQSFFVQLANDTAATVDGDSRVFTYFTSEFWPLDDQLFGNEGQQHNRYFTWEAHSYLTYTGGELLQFKSQDDLWVFINGQLPAGWDMQGVQQGGTMRQFVISLDAFFNSTAALQQTFPVDIFYAHRSDVNNAAIQLQLVSASLCNALSTGVTQFQYGFPLSTAAPATAPVAPEVWLYGQSQLTTLSTGQPAIALMPAATPFSVGLAYFGDSTGPLRLKIAHGFLCTFSFIGGGSTDGFTLIMHADSPYTWGGAAGNLGYAGATGITNSIAVEFDGLQTVQDGDPAWNHVSVHSQWLEPNVATEPGLGGLYSAASPAFTFFNQTSFDVTVLYTAPVEGSGQQTGQMQISIAPYAAPVLIAPINASLLTEIWDGSAYVGFTAGTGDTVYNSITLSNLSLIAIPPSAANSYIPAGGSPSPSSSCVAGTAVSMTVQLRDSCNNDLTIGGDEADVSASMAFQQSLPSSTQYASVQPLAATVSGALNDGSYQLSFSPTLAGLYLITVYYGGEAIGTAPFSYTVYPSTPYPALCFFNLSVRGPSASVSPHINIDSVLLNITTQDAYGNRVYWGTDSYALSFSPDVDANASYPTPLWNPLSLTYQAQVVANIAVSSSLYITLASADLSSVTDIATAPQLTQQIPFAITFLPGPASAATSSLQASAALSGATAGVAATFVLILRDASGNLISSYQNDSACQQPSSCLLQSSTSPALSVPVICSWSDPLSGMSCSYTAFVSGSYALNLSVNNAVMSAASAYTITVLAAAVDPANCLLAFYSAANQLLPTASPLLIAAASPVTLDVTARDSFNNSQPQGLAAGVVGATGQQTTSSFVAAPSPTSGWSLSAFSSSNGFLHYVATITGSVTGLYSLSVSLSGQQVFGSPFSLQVTQGAASALSSVMQPGVPAVLVAGVNASFLILSLDSQGNNRSAGGAGSDYLVQLIGVSAIAAFPVNDSASAVFNCSFGGELSGNYSLTVQVRSSGQNIVASPFSVSIEPAATSPSACLASGDGYSEGVEGTQSSFLIQAADRFGNAQWPTLHRDYFRIQLTNGSGATLGLFFANSSLTSSSSPGVYQASYAVPSTTQAGGSQFVITVTVLTAGGSWQPIGNTPVTAAILPSNTTLTTEIFPSADYPTPQVGRLNNWTIADTSASPTSASLSVLLLSEDGSLQFSQTASEVLSSRNYSFLFTPQLTLPLLPSGAFQPFFVNISRAGLLSASPQPTVTFSAGPLAPVNCRLSGLSGASSVVGSSVDFSLALYDAFSNRISANLSTPPAASAVCASAAAASATGNSSLWAEGEWSSTTQLYSFSLLPTVACSYSLEVSYAGSLLSGRTYTLSVEPGAVDASLSSVQPAAGASSSSSSSLSLSTTAGAAVALSVQLNDAYGNPVLQSSSPNASLTAELDDGATSQPPPALISASSYSGLIGRYGLTVTAYAASAPQGSGWPLLVRLAGQQLLNSPLNLSVSAASVSNCSVSSPAASVLAGAPFMLQLSCFDSYGNAALLTSSVLSLTAIVATPTQASVSTPLGSRSLSALFLLAPSTAAYQYLFVFNATQTAGRYNFSLQADGLLVDSAAAYFDSLAEQVDAANTLTPSVLPAVVAGQPTALLLQLRDQYGNVITDASLASLLSLQLSSWSGTYSCNSELWTDDTLMPQPVTASSLLGPALSVEAAEYLPDTAQFSLSFTVFVSGRFTVNASIAGTPLPCALLLPQLALNVLPAAASALHSQLMGVPLQAVAGQTVTLSVDLYDQYGNDVLDGSVALTVPADASASAIPLPAVLLSNSSNSVGQLVLAATPTLAGLYEAIVLLDSLPLRAVSSNSSIVQYWTVSPLFPVVPALPAAVVPLQLPAVVTVGIPFTLSLLLADAYSNLISASNPWYQLSLSLQGQTLLPSDYTFAGQSALLTLESTGSAAVSNQSAVDGLQPVVALQWTATSVWSGAASVQVTTTLVSPSSLPLHAAISVFLNASACGADHALAPFRCPDRSCVAEYEQCSSGSSGSVTVCPPSAPILCAIGGDCVADAESCACPANLTRCSLSRVCVSELSTDCFPAFTGCPAGTVACLAADGVTMTGHCRYSADDCPSPQLCPPSYTLCPDLFSCAAANSSCSDYSSLQGQQGWQSVTDAAAAALTAGAFRCWDGKFVSALSDCSTPKSCAAGLVLCLSDQSCQPEAGDCPAPYDCLDPAVPFRCPSGECRSAAADCPSSVSCPVGWLRCDDDSCATSLSQCLPAFNCSLADVRCADGSCQPTLALCPSRVSCPLSAPVSCSDGSCVASAAYCVSPSPCPATDDGAVCPDGSCVQSGAVCPTAYACPASSPVLCEDAATCAASVLDCPQVARCVAPNVVRCPDGSCRRASADCPTSFSCPSNRPVRCLDGSCAYASALCPAVISCPASAPVRCGGGECVLSSSLCPTTVTCSAGTSRCADGSCRFSCPSSVQLTCAVDTLACPQASAGLQCAASLSQCPQQAICPPQAPVRCIDASCAVSLSACPPLLSDPPSSLLPCPDGSWTADTTACGTMVTCPADFPFKCLDETCALTPADCPLPTVCNSSSSTTLYRCLNGGCVSSLTDAECETNSRVSCPASAPFKCVGSGEVCVAAVSLCPLPALYAQTLPSLSAAGTLTMPSNCPTGFLACRDGSCVTEVTDCAASATCPVYLPVLCASGVCARTAAACPDPVSGCYPQSARPHACWNGLCVAGEQECPTEVPADCAEYCTDGSCPPASITGPASSWCSDNGHSCALNCADRSCGLLPTDPTQTNLCTAGGVLTGFGTATHPGLGNVCPSWSPIRCDDGLCVASSLNCTALPQFDYCSQVSAGLTPFQCANGDCVVSGIQCPVLFSCASGLTRCGDGSCRLPSTCPPSGNSCPTFSADIAPLPDGSNRRPRCANGLCAPGTELSSCVDLSSGCPASAPFRCPNGACVAGEDDALCSLVTLPTANGCPSSLPAKCANGQCAANSSDCNAAADSGLSAASVSACDDGVPACVDGSCPASESGFCPAVNGCPVLTPWRCADGSCRPYPATAAAAAELDRGLFCPAVVQCIDASQSLCYDGSCAASPALCPPAPSSCASSPATPVLCPDLSCAATSANCSQQLPACPSAVPIVCDSGACVSSADQCYIYSIPGISAGGLQPITLNNGAAAAPTSSLLLSASAQALLSLHTGNVSIATPAAVCPPSLPYACFDGSCRTSWSACQSWSLLAHGVSAAELSNSTVDELSERLCNATTEVLCPNGLCAPATCSAVNLSCIELGCGVVAACSPTSSPLRCPDGSCVNTSTACPSMPACPDRTLPGYAALPQTRCEDGACRVSCLPFDGCPLSAPYGCVNRECATEAEGCTAQAVGSMFVFSDADLQQIVVADTEAQSSSQLQAAEAAPHSAVVSADMSAATSPFATVAFSSSSSSASSAVTVSAPLTAGGSLACWTSCWSQVKALSASFQVSLAASSSVSFLSNGYSVLQSSIDIPAYALTLAAQSNATVATIRISPVSDSRMRDAENRIPASRQSEYGSLYLTFPETVVSAAFQLDVDDVVLPFPLSLQVHASADIVTSSSEPVFAYADICLGQLTSFPVFGFSYWSCVIEDAATRLAVPVYDAARDAPLPPTVLTGYISAPGCYAFIRSPAPAAASSPSSSFIAQNLLIIALSLGLGVAVIAAVLYVFKRLHRYRAKYHSEREEVAAKREEVEEMEMFGGQAGRKDEEVVMTQNPLSLQLQDLTYAQAVKGGSAVTAQVQPLSSALTATASASASPPALAAQQSRHRQQHIAQLQADNETMSREMTELTSLLLAANSQQRKDEAGEEESKEESAADAEPHAASTALSPSAPAHNAGAQS